MSINLKSTNSSSPKVVSGLLWTYAERMTAQGISLIVSIILARLLTPNEYGLISIVIIFISFCDAFLVGGLGNSLIQKKDSDELDASTIFYCSIFLSIFLYLVLFVTAPLISDFYNIPLLIPIIRVLGLRLPISGFNTIQQAIVQKKMAFKSFFYATIIGTCLSGFLGVFLAFKGFGVWALVAQYLSKTLIDTIVLFFINKWIPLLQFSWKRAKSLWNYGWKLLVTNLVYTLEGNCRGLIVGKVFGPSDLAYYDQGNKFPNIIVGNINSSISKVLFPALALEQDDLGKVKGMCRRSVKTGLFLLAPLMIGLMVVAKDFVLSILTEKWLPCVPFLRILAFVYLLKPLATMCQQSILAIGRSDITLKVEIIQSLLAITLLCVSVFYFEDILMIAWSNVVVELIGLSIFMYYVHKLVGYKFREQISDVFPTLLISLFMGVIIYMVHFLNLNSIAILSVQIFSGAIIYVALSKVFKINSFEYLVRFIKNNKK